MDYGNVPPTDNSLAMTCSEGSIPLQLSSEGAGQYGLQKLTSNRQFTGNDILRRSWTIRITETEPHQIIYWQRYALKEHPPTGCFSEGEGC